MPGPYWECALAPTAMAELPRIVMALNGSTTLRVAIQRFSLGVIGFTCGPLVNRIYQLIVFWGGQGAGCVSGWPLAPAGAIPATEDVSVVAAVGLTPFAAGQGAVVGVATGVGLFGSGASGNDSSGLSGRPAHLGIA